MIVSTVRTALGRRGKSLRETSIEKLAALDAVVRSGIHPAASASQRI